MNLDDEAVMYARSIVGPVNHGDARWPEYIALIDEYKAEHAGDKS